MRIFPRSHSADADEFGIGPIGPHVGAYKQYLSERGYAGSTIASYLVGVAHFGRWMYSQRLPLLRIDEQRIGEFLDDHLPGCRCPGPVRRDRRDQCAALGHLLVVLRSCSAIPPRATGNSSAVDEELSRYGVYMEDVRGLAPKTRDMALRIVGRLLVTCFGENNIDIAAIKPEQVRRFFAQQAALYSKPANAGVVVAALRSYFRYRTSIGDRVHALIRVVSYPANWQLSTLPKTLTTAEVKQLISSLGAPGPSMRRTAAIVRCALDLGLRCGEIARLGLDDIDWYAGAIMLRHTKGRREDVLPLPAATGEAIAAYLKHERPKSSNRAVFVRHISPRDQPGGPDLVRMTIRRAFARAGLPYTRSHLLRHTMANRLLAGGASLKEVADVLRHRSLNTTMIYAKLDSRNLVEVALPWPGSSS